jgi:xanthine dehydrogenase YagT iron-sulfur-binding subunit
MDQSAVSPAANHDTAITAVRVTVETGSTALSIGPGSVPLTLLVNGRELLLLAEPGMTLAEALRSVLGLTGTKIGCDRGACSACTVWLDGEVAASCMTFVLDARGRAITTIEGLGDRSALHPVQQAFVAHDAMQCGFCTPGMVMSCAALVERQPDCTVDDVRSAISGHLCRCGAYPNIFSAVIDAAKAVRERRATADGSRP